MAIFGREFIAVPDEKKNQIVFKWPDHEIRRFTRAIVAPDEMAVFIRQGEVIGTLGPGRYVLDATELPILGAVADTVSGGNMYRTELYFVSSREVMDRFGGQIDEVQDPQTGLLVTLRVYGDYVLKVTDPATLIVKFVGTQDVPDNDRIFRLSEDLLLRGLRTDLVANIVRNGWPVLGLAAYTDDMERAAVTAGNRNLADYGLTITRMTNFTVTLDEATEAELRRLAKDTAYSRLAGSFQQYAAGEAALGAGEGMAKGGAATGGALFAAGLGIGGQAVQPYPPGPPPPPPPAQGGPSYVGPPPQGPGPAPGAGSGPVGAPPAGVPPAGAAGSGAAGGTVVGTANAAPTCPRCGTGNPPQARFCISCGAALAPSPAVCPACGATNPPGARFCASCGTALAAAPAASPGAPATTPAPTTPATAPPAGEGPAGPASGSSDAPAAPPTDPA